MGESNPSHGFIHTNSAAIGQTGQIPLAALSLIFWGYAGSSDVSFAGQILPLILLGSKPNHNIYGTDISTLAGQTGQLLFTAQPNFVVNIDNIQFSPTAVPEPNQLALAALGTLLLGFRRRKKSG